MVIKDYNTPVDSALRQAFTQAFFQSLHQEFALSPELQEKYGVVGATVEGGSSFHFAGLDHYRDIHDIDLNIRGNRKLEEIASSKDATPLLWNDVEVVLKNAVESMGGELSELTLDEGMRVYTASFDINSEAMATIGREGEINTGKINFPVRLNGKERDLLQDVPANKQVSFDIELKSLKPTPFLPPLNRETRKPINLSQTDRVQGLMLTDFREVFAQKLLGYLTGKETDLLDFSKLYEEGLVDIYDPLLTKIVITQMAAFGKFPELFDTSRLSTSPENVIKIKAAIDGKMSSDRRLSEEKIAALLGSVQSIYSTVLGFSFPQDSSTIQIPELPANDKEFIDKVRRGDPLSRADVENFYSDLPQAVLLAYPDLIENTYKHPYILETIEQQHLATNIRKAYPRIGKILSVKQAAIAQGREDKVSYIVNASSGTYYAHIFYAPSLSRVELMRGLYEKGMPVPKQFGNTVPFGDGTLVLEAGLYGEHKRLWKMEHIADVAKNMARLHNATSEQAQDGTERSLLEEPLLSKMIQTINYIKQTIDSTVNTLKTDGDDSRTLQEKIVSVILKNANQPGLQEKAEDFARAICDQDFIPRIENMLTRVTENAPQDDSNIHRSLVHLDTHPGNILFNKDNTVSGILDWELSEVSYSIADVVDMLSILPDHTDIDADEARTQFIKSYTSERPLSAAEIEAGKFYMAALSLEGVIHSSMKLASALAGKNPTIYTDPVKAMSEMESSLSNSDEGYRKLFASYKEQRNKIAVIAMQFPPTMTQTYTVGDIKAFEEMGYNLTIFSPKDYRDTPDIPVNHGHGLKGNVIILPPTLLRGVEEGEWENQNNRIIDALDKFSDSPELLSGILTHNAALKPHANSIIEAIKYFHDKESYKEARMHFGIDLDFHEPQERKIKRPLKFIQGLVMAHHLMQNDISLVYANSFPTSATVASYAARIAGDGVKWGMQGHNGDIDILSDWETYHKVHEADFVTVTAPSAQERLREIVPELTNIPIIYRGIYPEQFCAPKEPRPPADGSSKEKAIELLLVGRLIEKKGHTYVLQALKHLPKDFHVHVTFVGNGELLATLEQEAKDLGISHLVTFAGHKDQPDVADAYRRSDILLMPSVMPADGDGEALNTVIMEAAATELPCIASDHGDAKAFVETGVTGTIIPARDAQALADAIVGLGKNPSFRSELGEKSREKVLAHFDYKTIRLPLRDQIEAARSHPKPRRRQESWAGAGCVLSHRQPDTQRLDPHTPSRHNVIRHSGPHILR